MMEEMRDTPKQIFEKGMLVKMREELPEGTKNNWSEVLDTRALHRVLHVGHVPEFGEVAWIGPSDTTPRNVADFVPGMEYTEPRYFNVVLMVTENLRTVHN